MRHLYEQKKAGNEDGIKAAQAMVDSIAAARSMTQDDLTTAFRRAGEVTVVDQAEDGMLVVNRVKEYFAPDTFQGAEAAANAEMEIRPKSVQVEAVGDGSASIDNVVAGIEDAPAQAGDSANNAQLAFADVAQVEDAGEDGQGRKKKSVRFAGTETIDFDFADRGRYASELQDAPEMLEWQMFHGTDVGELGGMVKARGKKGKWAKAHQARLVEQLFNIPVGARTAFGGEMGRMFDFEDMDALTKYLKQNDAVNARITICSGSTSTTPSPKRRSKHGRPHGRRCAGTGNTSRGSRI